MKISFTDFWGGFHSDNNFIINLIRTLIPEVEVIPLSDDTDVLFYSCYTHEHTRANRSKTKKIFYTGENLRPNYQDCDYSLTFDFDDYGGKNFRLPLWMLQIDWFKKVNYDNPRLVVPLDQLDNNEFTERPKDNFCAFVFNTDSPYRYEIVEKLSKYKKVDCFGKPFGNWFYGEDIKLNTISKYKFNICFENSLFSGYFTEKLFHAKVAGTVPIYWADSTIGNDFNTKGFINLYDFNNEVDKLIDYVIKVDQDVELYNKYRSEKLFNTPPSLSGITNFLKQIL